MFVYELSLTDDYCCAFMDGVCLIRFVNSLLFFTEMAEQILDRKKGIWFIWL